MTNEIVEVIKKPEMLEVPNLESLRDLLKEYINSIEDGTYHEDNDIDHYIYEEAVMAFYGKKIFENYINKKY